jgi:hypothetical protein
MNKLKSGVEQVHNECVLILRVELRKSGGNSDICEKNACKGSLFDFV